MCTTVSAFVRYPCGHDTRSQMFKAVKPGGDCNNARCRFSKLHPDNPHEQVKQWLQVVMAVLISPHPVVHKSGPCIVCHPPPEPEDRSLENAEL
ncbi:hypothetical protein AURDEDRAFT_161500 [Auricularia subglabra TFB-10046 SS5]|nr:hypothetical protein AURDEDRAFT_161500 [Auricularia subglabra TFB-10046 SS5]